MNMFAEKLTHMLDKPARLPTFPVVVAEILSLLDNPNAGLGDVARVVAKDPVLAARVMRLAASAAFAGVSAPDTVMAAVGRVGQKGVREVALYEGLRRTFPPTRIFDHRAFWKHSLAVGWMAELLAPATNAPGRLGAAAASLFTAGLLHDIGLALYMTIDEVSLIELLARKGESHESLEDIEREYLGLSHVDAGLALCHHWRLSEIAASAVVGHHEPDRAPAGALRAVAQIVHLADHLCAIQGLGDFGEQPVATFKASVAVDLGISVDKFPALLRAGAETAKRLAAFES